jgi:mitochondrial fission protein ELM1
MSDRADVPRVWALLSDTAGDNAQVLALAEALGWPSEIHRFRNRKGAMVANFLMGPNLPAMVKQVSGHFGPPWPDLVIAAGTPSEPICALLRMESRRANHSMYQVFLGRPWAKPELYNLIVTTPQYWVPPAPNVMMIELPLHRTREADRACEAAVWAPRIAHLPRPRVAVFVGGGISRYILDTRAATRLALEASALVSPMCGSLLVCGSYRTPRFVTEVLADNLAVPSHIFDWRQGPKDNPYLALLDLADQFIVTGDSMTMLAEACATGKPVHIFDLGEGQYGMRQPPAARGKVLVRHPWLMSALRARVKDFEVRLTRFVLPRRFQRDTRPIHRNLVQSGRAVWLGDAFPPGRASTPNDGSHNADGIANRIRKDMGLG